MFRVRAAFMAKQRRPAPKSTKAPATPSAGRTARPTEAAAPLRPAAPAATTPDPPGAQRRTTHFEAVALYERGLEALQKHAYAQAANLLESVLRLYPEERDLHERVRLYLNICRRHAASQGGCLALRYTKVAIGLSVLFRAG